MHISRATAQFETNNVNGAVHTLSKPLYFTGGNNQYADVSRWVLQHRFAVECFGDGYVLAWGASGSRIPVRGDNLPLGDEGHTLSGWKMSMSCRRPRSR